MKDKKEEGFNYRYTIDKDQAFLYANPKCKHCYGKGYIVSQLPLVGSSIRKNLPSKQSMSYCTCYYKKKKKFS